MRRVTAFMIRYPVWVTVLLFGIVVFGLISLSQLRYSFFPEIEPDIIQVQVVYPGASPEEVAEGVVLKIEENIDGLEGVERITSVSRENMGTVTVEVLKGADIELVLADVKNAVDRINSFPVDAEKPVIFKQLFRTRSLSIVLFGKADLYNLKHIAEAFRDDLLADPEISQVSIEGLPALEISIEVSEERLRRYQLTFAEVARADARLTPDEIERVVLVGGSTRMPSVRDLVEETFHKKPFVRINPDEVVGIGAAVQAGVLMGEIHDVVLVDVTPLSLGIETEGGLFARIISRNATIPTSASQIFTNAEDDQTVMDFHVLQGEREMAIDNMSLGQFQLTDIPPLPRGKAHVEVTFEIDVNGIVKVSAEEIYTEAKTGIRIDASHLLSEEEVNIAVREAEAHAEEDRNRRGEVEINIRADSMIRAAELFLEERDRKLSKASKGRIEEAISNLKEALSEGESAAIEERTEVLRKMLERS